MEINNIPKIAVNTATDSHHGVVLFGSALAVWVAGRRRRRVCETFFNLSGLSQ